MIGATLLAAKGAVMGSYAAKVAVICGAVVLGTLAYGQYKYWQGGDSREARIVKNTKKAGRKKNVAARKVRQRIKPSTAGDSLWDKYGAN